MRFIAIGTFLIGVMIFTQVDWVNSQPAENANPPGIASPNGGQLSKAVASGKEPTGERGEGRKGVRPEKVRAFMGKFAEYLQAGEEKLRQMKAPPLTASFNLNEEELLQIMEEMGRQSDFKTSSLDKKSKAEQQELWFRTIAFMSLDYKLSQKWESQYPQERDLIVKKIVPVMKSSDESVKRFWIGKIGKYARKVHNSKLTLSEKDRNLIADELFVVFESSSSSLDSRLAAVEAWIPAEIRDDRKRAAFEIISRDVEVFEKRAFHMLSLNRASSPAPWIYDKMFEIIEMREKHDPRVVKGAIEFCWRMMSGCGEFGGLAECPQKLERLKQALVKSLTHETGPEFKKEYDELLEATAEAEKFHGERELQQKMEEK